MIQLIGEIITASIAGVSNGVARIFFFGGGRPVSVIKYNLPKINYQL